MPKIIENIEERIFASAQELFYEQGYEQVNIRQIARKSGIAVGTLYNYYSNKNEIYLAVLNKSWNKTFEKINNIVNDKSPSVERLKECIQVIYDEIIQRKGLGIQIRKAKGLEGKEFISLENSIKENIAMFFSGMNIKAEFKEDKEIIDKLVYTILINITMLIELFPQDRDNNVEYIYNLICSFIQ